MSYPSECDYFGTTIVLMGSGSIDIVATRRLSAEDNNERCNVLVGPTVSCTAVGSPDLDARKHSTMNHYEDIEISAV